ncbi:MAG: histidinol-phosphatase [Spirochaetia bacterium]|jgi:histidinol-phosphatase (PHP family)|nr:histidinol-phosphatase [Spirochaetia bacterium]
MKMNKSITTNYHTHTFRCKHATGDAIDYAKTAWNKGMRTLGFSEHTPLPDNRWNNVRMDMDQLDSYDEAISKAQEAFPGLNIIKGMECDWVPEFDNFYKEEFREKRDYKYLIGSIHWFKSEGEWIFTYSPEAFGKAREYADLLIEMIESQSFDFIAHPDLFGLFSRKWTAETTAVSRAICEAAKSYNTPLEINGYGLRKPKIEAAEGIRYAYPVDKFWEIASDYGIEVVCNSDAHNPEDVNKSIDLCMEIADRHYLSQAEFDFDKCPSEVFK